MPIANGRAARCVSELMGHADIRDTAIYLHVSKCHLRAASSPLEALPISPPGLRSSPVQGKANQKRETLKRIAQRTNYRLRIPP
jgi:hypothetical protein